MMACDGLVSCCGRMHHLAPILYPSLYSWLLPGNFTLPPPPHWVWGDCLGSVLTPLGAGWFSLWVLKELGSESCKHEGLSMGNLTRFSSQGGLSPPSKSDLCGPIYHSKESSPQWASTGLQEAGFQQWHLVARGSYNSGGSNRQVSPFRYSWKIIFELCKSHRDTP